MGIFHFCPLEKLKITRIEVEAYQEVSLYLHVLTLHMCCSLGCFPFVRTDRPDHSCHDEKFTFNHNYSVRSVKFQTVGLKGRVLQRKPIAKAFFIVKMTCPAMVRPASSDFWNAP